MPAPIPVIFITGHGHIPMSVRAMKAGAIDFLTKPFRDQDLLDAVTRALERDRKRRNDEKASTSFPPEKFSPWPKGTHARIVGSLSKS